MPAGPTERTLQRLRQEGYPLVQVVEKWNPWGRVRVDLFGIIDIVAVRDGETYGIQCTSYPNVPARVKKITESDATPELRKAGWHLSVWGWRKVKNRYQVRVVDVS